MSAEPYSSAEWEPCPPGCAYCCDPFYGHPRPHPGQKRKEKSREEARLLALLEEVVNCVTALECSTSYAADAQELEAAKQAVMREFARLTEHITRARQQLGLASLLPKHWTVQQRLDCADNWLASALCAGMEKVTSDK